MLAEFYDMTKSFSDEVIYFRVRDDCLIKFFCFFFKLAFYFNFKMNKVQLIVLTNAKSIIDFFLT